MIVCVVFRRFFVETIKIRLMFLILCGDKSFKFGDPLLLSDSKGIRRKSVF